MLFLMSFYYLLVSVGSVGFVSPHPSFLTSLPRHHRLLVSQRTTCPQAAQSHWLSSKSPRRPLYLWTTLNPQAQPFGAQPGHVAFSGPSTPLCCLHPSKKNKKNKNKQTSKIPAASWIRRNAQDKRTSMWQAHFSGYPLSSGAWPSNFSQHHPVFGAFGTFLKHFIQLLWFSTAE